MQKMLQILFVRVQMLEKEVKTIIIYASTDSKTEDEDFVIHCK